MNRRQRRAFGDYGAKARAALPGYVTPGSPCDACGQPVVGSRTITWVSVDGDYLSVLVRTCTEHTDCPIAELAAKLPNLPTLDGVGYLQL